MRHSVVEQRRSKRFEIKLPVKVVRNGVRAISAAGETRNLSSSGVLFTSDTRVELGEAIEYVISLAGEGEVNLHCIGKVIRLEDGFAGHRENGAVMEVAATLERYEFIRR
jgi:hypothetical protein